MNAAINHSDIEIAIANQQQPQKPPEPLPHQQLILEDQPISLNRSFVLRLFFVNILTIIKNFFKFQGKLTMKQCPMVNDEEIFNGRKLQFERSIMRTNDEDKQDQTYFSPNFKCIIYLFSAFKKDVITIFFLILLQMISRIAIPLTVQKLLQHSDSPYKFALTIVLIVLLLIGLVLRHFNGNYGHQIGLKMRTLIIKTLYAKIQRLHSTTLTEEAYITRIDQHLTRDLQNIQQKMYFLFITLTMPITLLCSAGLLTYWNGFPGLIGFCYFLLMFLVHIVMNLAVQKYIVAANSLAKEKLTLLKQTLKGIRIIKISTWEKAFYEMMSALKDRQTKQIFKKYVLTFIQRSISLSSPAVASMIIFLAAFYINENLDFSKSFATLQLLLSIRFNIMYFSQMGIDYFYELKDFVKQFRETLLKQQFVMFNTNEELFRIVEPKGDLQVLIQNTNISCSETRMILNNVNLEIKKGFKYSLSGSVGSGKSSLLHFLIRQAHHYFSTKVQITKSIAYVGQQHYFMKDTIRNNILFGKKFNEDLYKRVIFATSLYTDLKRMSKEGQGDKTIILEGGSNLSGGQKTRIILARALYQQKNLYLLDNVLSDLNTEVVSDIIVRVFKGMLKDKSVILSTSNRYQFDSIMNAHIRIEQKDSENVVVTEFSRSPDIEQICWMEDFDIQEIEAKKKVELPNTQQQTSVKTYIKYASFSKNWYKWFGVVLLFICGEVIFSMFVYNLKSLTLTVGWNSSWSICLGLAFLLGFCYLLKYVSMSGLVLSRNKSIFKKMFSRILRCKLGSLEQYSQGQIQERFDGDMKSVDNIMPIFVCDSFQSPLLYLNMLITISIIIPWFIPCGVIATIGNFLLYKLCVVSLSKTRKLDLRTKVPIRGCFQDFYQGSTQIKCYNVQSLYFQKFRNKLSEYYRANLLYGNVQRATAFIIQSCTMIASIIGVVLIYHMNQSLNTAQDLLYVIALSDYIQFGIRQIALLDGQLMSIQKIYQLEKIVQETDHFYDQSEELFVQNQQSPTIQFKNVRMRYPNGKLALNNVNFFIEKEEKIGVIGRTGAGKTSLLNALFRFEDLEKQSGGQILINNVDISNLSLGRLRNMFGVIPQNPFLFKSSIKKNIDPSSKYTQEHMLSILEKVFCRPFSQGQLNSATDNLSAGQKQLITICRCLLRKPKILILDEATSSIDSESTQKFLRIVNEQCKSTTINIAHLIRTIEDCRRLIVMDDGQAEVVKIFDSYRDSVREN